MTLLGRMDRLVFATGFDRILFMKFQPRSFRWAPVLVIATLIVGYTLTVDAGNPAHRSFWIGWLLFYGAYLAAMFLRVFGPRFTGTANRPVDEREVMVKARAYAVSGIVFATLAMFGCFYMASEGVPGLWHPHGYERINLGFGVQALATLLPTWIASWIEPRPHADPED